MRLESKTFQLATSLLEQFLFDIACRGNDANRVPRFESLWFDHIAKRRARAPLQETIVARALISTKASSNRVRDSVTSR